MIFFVHKETGKAITRLDYEKLRYKTNLGVYKPIWAISSNGAEQNFKAMKGMKFGDVTITPLTGGLFNVFGEVNDSRVCVLNTNLYGDSDERYCEAIVFLGAEYEKRKLAENCG